MASAPVVRSGPGPVAEATAAEGRPGRGPAAGRELILLAIAVVGVNMALGIQSAAYTNFAVDDLHIRAGQLGMVEAIRECSGLLCLLVAAVGARLPLPRFAAGALVVMGLGLTLVGHAHTIGFLMVANFVWGMGFHTYSPISPTLTLGLTRDRTHQAGMLSWLSGVGAFAAPVGTLLLLLSLPLFGLRGEYLPAGVVAFGAGMVMAFVPNSRPGPRPRIVLRAAYLPYYLLTCADGARRQILSTFAVFALVSIYHASVVTVSLLLLGTSLLIMLASPWVGRLIARYGERAVIVTASLLLVPLFAGYGLTTSEAVMITLYLLDNTLFVSSVALTTWVSQNVATEDVAPTLAAGTTFNHIAAVTVPLVAGFVWQAYGYHVIFFGGTVIAAATAIGALVLLPSRRRRAAAAPG